MLSLDLLLGKTLQVTSKFGCFLQKIQNKQKLMYLVINNDSVSLDCFNTGMYEYVSFFMLSEFGVWCFQNLEN